jgi:hypothetical protein
LYLVNFLLTKKSINSFNKNFLSEPSKNSIKRYIDLLPERTRVFGPFKVIYEHEYGKSIDLSKFKNLNKIILYNYHDISDLILHDDSTLNTLFLDNCLDQDKSKQLLSKLSNFQNLTKLNLSEDKLSNIKLSGNIKLFDLNISDNKIEEINLSKNINLEHLNLSNNQIKDINLLENIKLIYLNISINKIKFISLNKNINLIEINLSNNQLHEIDLSKNINLIEINLSNNQLHEIDLSNNINLRKINLSNNNFLKLDLSNNKELNKLNLIGCKYLKELILDEKYENNQFFQSNFKHDSNLKIIYKYKIENWLNKENKTIHNLVSNENYLLYGEANLSQFPNLTKIILPNNQIEGLNLLKNTNLNEIDLSNNLLKNQINLINNLFLKKINFRNNPYLNNVFLNTIFKNNQENFFFDPYVKKIYQDLNWELKEKNLIIKEKENKRKQISKLFIIILLVFVLIFIIFFLLLFFWKRKINFLKK